MSDDDDVDFSEAFTKANANLEFIATQYADVLRHLMRAVSSEDPSSGACRAAQCMNFVAELLSKTEEKFSFLPVVSEGSRGISG